MVYSEMPFLSVIIPVRNEEENIENCLISLLRQTYPRFEIIAIDDNSNDKTLELMRKVEAKQVSGKIILKILTISGKPVNWTGKTWASEQGFMHSRGDLLLFTDGDTEFQSQNALALSVSQMMSENLDVLTGVPYFPLRDFWSRVVMPVWNLYSEIFGRGIADVNDPRSSVAFVMGSFFMIKRSIFERVGTYKSVKTQIQEDKSLGELLKKNQFKIKMVKVDTLISALWSRDGSTLWHGIQRSISPTLIEHRFKVLSQIALIFIMIILPFVLLPYTLTTGTHLLQSITSMVLANPALTSLLSWNLGLRDISSYSIVNTVSFVLNICLCVLIIIAVAIKSLSKYKLVPIYSIFCGMGALFLMAAYLGSFIPLLKGQRSPGINWKGRTQVVVPFDSTAASH